MDSPSPPRSLESAKHFQTLTPLRLPRDRPRAHDSIAEWSELYVQLDAASVDALARMALESGLPRDAVFLGAWQLLLARWTGQHDIAVLARSARSADASSLWSVRCDVSHPCSLREAAARADRQLAQALAREWRWAPGLPGGYAMFDGFVSTSSGIAVDDAELVLGLCSSADAITARLRFRADLLARASVRRMLDHYARLLSIAAADVDAAGADLPLLSDDERAHLLERCNETARPYPAALRVHELFEPHAHATPDAVALIHDGVEISYGVLNARADQLARHLCDLGVAPDVVVGVCLDRSPNLLVAILAVLKAGGAYLPLDPTLPDERLAFMLEDAGAGIVVLESALGARLQSLATIVVCVDGDAPHIQSGASHVSRAPSGTPEDLAYVIYTSGSTGKPKGVMVPHRAVVNFLASMQRAPGFTARDRLLAATTISFDPSVLELLLPLVSGGTVVLAGSQERVDPLRLCEMIDEFEITTMCAAATMWGQMLGTGWRGRAGLRAIVGGEALCKKLARDLLSRCEALWNQYGPTEATVAATCWRVSDPEQGTFIGTPIANVRCLVLDERMQLVPLGAHGELYIGGLGLARGYVKRDELTAERFVSDPHLPGARLYRTGDVVRWHASGELEFCGRIDQQVKLRGHRVELGEIEAELDACDGVRASAALVREDRPGDARLVAYVAGHDLDPRLLRAQLARKLPSYMLPSAITVRDALPVMPSGKVDRRALAALEPTAAAAEQTEPATALDALQRSLTAEWQDVLNLRSIGLDDDFFELGGHSLLAISLLARIAARFGQRLNPAAFLAAPTIRAQAELLRAGLSARRTRCLVPIRASGARPPLFFASGWGGPILSLRALADALGREQPLYLLDYVGGSRGDSKAATIGSIAAVLIAEIRSVLPEGPYQLAGFSLGADIVYEMARQLHASGESVSALILLDRYAPGHPHIPPLPLRAILHAQRALRLGPRRMWPYLLEQALKVRRFVAEGQPKLYEGVSDALASPIIDELSRAAGVVVEACKHHRVERYPGRLMLITAADMSAWGIGAFDDDPTGGWSEWAGQATHIGAVPCAHKHLLDVEHSAKLAEFIGECLLRVATPHADAPRPQASAGVVPISA